MTAVLINPILFFRDTHIEKGMKPMEQRQLRRFVAVADELHFTRAAARLGIPQPALSLHIRQLEEELGLALFHRTKRRVELTAAGQMLLAEARRGLAPFDLGGGAGRPARPRGG